MSEGRQDVRKGVTSRRSLSPETSSKVSLIQTRLLSKANRSISDLSQGNAIKGRPASASRLIHSVRRTVSTTQLRQSLSPSLLPPSLELQSPRVVKTALMGNVLKVRKETKGEPIKKEEHKIQVKVELTKPGPSSSSSSFRGKAKEILTIKSSSSSSNGSNKKELKKSSKSSSKLPKTVKICNTVSVQNGANATEPLNNSAQPIKPPRKTKISEKSSSNGSKVKKCISSPPPPTPNSDSGLSRPESPLQEKVEVKRSSSASPTNSSSLKKSSSRISKTLSEGLSKMITSKLSKTESSSPKKVKKNVSKEKAVPAQPNYTVTQKPLAPPADSTPKNNCDYMSLPLLRRYHVYSSSTPSLYRSLPTLTPYLRETKRVTNSVFLRTRSPSPLLPCPRPTKTSLMREIISKDPSLKDFKGANLEAECVQDLAGVKPRQRRRRSVSCLNLRDYSQYILALRHSHGKRSPRFSRLHKLYSSLERLCELERSTTSLYDVSVLPSSKKNDFDAWWKVRNRLRIDEEIHSLSKELLEAQQDREFFFRPKTPLAWCPVQDSHLRFKKWSVDQLKGLLGEKGKGFSEFKLDLYKTQWRGSTVKELALNLEVNELYNKNSAGGVRTPYLRRAFSMSSTLSEEQREGIKERIGHLITTAASKRGSGQRESRSTGGRPTVTSRMGFTLSSDPKKIEDLKPSPDCGLSETKKKEISQMISEEFKERRVKESNILRDSFLQNKDLPVSTKMLLRKTESFGGNKKKSSLPFYSVYCRNGVNNRIKNFEGNNDIEEIKERKRIVHAVAPTPNQNLLGPTSTAKITKTKDFILQSKGPPPFRSQSPLMRSPSPPTRRSVTPTRINPTLPKEYVSHINIISKLAALLLKRNTSLKSLVTREVLERDKLERLRSLNSGEVERLCDFFEDKQTYEDLRELAVKSPEINLLRCLFCSDSNLAKITEKLDPDHRRRCASAGGDIDSMIGGRVAPEGSSPTPKKTSFNLSPSSARGINNYLGTRSRKPIYQPSSTPNVCQPTLTAHCYLTQQDSIERLESPEFYDYGQGYDSLPLSYTYSSPSSLSSHPPQQQQNSISPQRRILDERFRGGFSYNNYDPSAHQPRYRYVPQPPVLPHVKRSGSALAYAQHQAASGSLRRAESFHSAPTTGRRAAVQSPPYRGQQGYPHMSMYGGQQMPVMKPPRKGYSDYHHALAKKLYFDYGVV